jgi:hypothetical protein
VSSFYFPQIKSPNIGLMYAMIDYEMLNATWLVGKDMDVNEHERLSNFTLSIYKLYK